MKNKKEGKEQRKRRKKVTKTVYGCYLNNHRLSLVAQMGIQCLIIYNYCRYFVLLSALLFRMPTTRRSLPLAGSYRHRQQCLWIFRGLVGTYRSW